MKIKTIGRTVSFGNYENMSMTAELEDGDDVSASVDRLNSLLQGEIQKRDSSINLVYDVARLEADHSRLSQDISVLSSRKQQAIEWCKKHGLDVDRFEDLPF